MRVDHGSGRGARTCSSGCSAAMKATRHSPSSVMAMLPDLEGVRGRELVALRRLPADEVVVAVPVDEVLLPGEQGRPAGVLRQDRVPLVVGELGAEVVRVGDDHGRRAVVEAGERIEAHDLERAVRIAHRQLLGVGDELGDGLRRARDAGLGELRLVVVEAPRVGEQRQGACACPGTACSTWSRA